MIDDLKPYSSMKNSGVLWLGDVPAHWEIRRFKYLLREPDARSDSGAEQLLRVSQYTGVTERKRTNGQDEPDTRAASLIGYKHVQPGELAVNIMLAWNGSMGVSPFTGVVSPAYCVYRFGVNTEPWYFHYLLRSPSYKVRIKAVSTGVVESRLRLYTDDLYRLEGLLPPLSEQAAIVRFLDHADRRIRRYIRAKQKLIALLEEQKQALIHQVITGQINVRTGQPYPAYKPSGVEWLGEVPKHWEIRRLNHLTRFHNGLAFKPDDWSGDGVPIIRIQNLNGSDEFNYTIRQDLPVFLLIRPGDLLFSWSGNRGTSFGAYVWDRDFSGYLNQHIFKLDGYSLDRGYFAHLLRAVTKHVEENTHGIIGLVHITKPDLGRILVPVAPSEEQPRIAQAIEDSLARLQAALHRIQRQSELIQGYRTRLIADVVTGKLDVREAAAGLPEVDPLEGDGDLDETPDIGDPEAEVSELALGKEEAEA